MPDRPFNVLFLCTHNSARSLMAEAILRERGGDRFVAHSAGVTPKAAPDPLTLETLRLARVPYDGLRPKSRDVFREVPLDFVFTVCNELSGEACPPWEGQAVSADWSIDDPAATDGAEHLRRVAFQQAFRLLDNRIKIFVALPLGSLDRMSLQHRLDAIGRTGGTAVDPSAS
jgi:arsenate reductase